jgi:hypothetical protein
MNTSLHIHSTVGIVRTRQLDPDQDLKPDLSAAPVSRILRRAATPIVKAIRRITLRRRRSRIYRELSAIVPANRPRIPSAE